MVMTGSNVQSLPDVMEEIQFFPGGDRGGLKNATEAVRCLNNKKANISLCGAIKWPPLVPFSDELRRGTDWINVTLLRKVVFWAGEP